jgi:activating signal cointegrator complex subunit 3
MNEILARDLRQSANSRLGKPTEAIERPDYSSPHTKTALLLQAHFERFTPDQLPIADYGTDMKTVLDSSIRILQAMIDTCAEYRNDFAATIKCIEMMQCLKSGCWWNEHALVASSLLGDASFLRDIADQSLAECLMSLRQARCV